MATKVICTELSLPWFTVQALAFIPSVEEGHAVKKEWAFFTHGYTSHKGDCLNWATRLVEVGVPCVIFDHPGHYLGSFYEANSLEEFKAHSHEIFGEAFVRMNLLMEQTLGVGQYPPCTSVILGGHSLGAFNCIRATELPVFKDFQRVAVAIGSGVGQNQANHLFESAFYEKTLSIRRQLVSPALDSKEVFAWLRKDKMEITVSNQRIHIITGEDDVVVGPTGVETFKQVLEANGNIVSVERPKKLPHHEPGHASPHIYSFLKNHFGWK